MSARGTPPREAASACSEFLADADGPAVTWRSRVIDFLALCVLAWAMAVMEEPKRAGRITPPPVPWLELGQLIATLAVAVASLAFLLPGGAS